MRENDEISTKTLFHAWIWLRSKIFFLGHRNGLSDNGFGGSLEDLNNMMGPNCSGIARKSQNMTECVPVPTSEHVAEIVGRQGKIKY